MFDFDYTLADSSEAIIQCFNVGLASLGLPSASDHAIRSTIGLSLEESLVSIAGESHRLRANDFRRAWREHSDVVMLDLTRLLPGADETVRTLTSQQRRMGVVSTKYRRRIEEVLARAELSGSFETVIGGDDVGSHKPNPEGLLLALDRMRVAPADAVYLGDSVVDAEAAQRAGVAFVGVLTGVTSPDRLSKWNCVDILPSIAALPAWLASQPEAVMSL